MRLLDHLHELQLHERYLSAESLRTLAMRVNVPLYRLQELVSFYPHFRTSPPADVEISVCRDVACWLAEPDAPARIRKEQEGNSSTRICETSCLGRCDTAPAALRNDIPMSLSGRSPAAPAARYQCDPYAGPGEYYAVIRKLRQEPGDASSRVIAELKESGLRGMGGAGFPTAMKWEFVAQQPGDQKYVICNADESEPGTFKDREILANLSHLVIEGMLIAGRAVGATHGILFIRHEYEPERKAFERALESGRESGALGDFHLEVVVSPGGYILGEETALLECLEDRRGEPRNKPPFPGESGLHGAPTLINNVETLAMVPGIIAHGGAWWKNQGRPGFQGLKFISVSGHICNPGVYEVAIGTTVRELIDLAGGISGNRALLAFAPGGASSNFLPATAVDVPLDFNAVKNAGSMLGSGALLVVAEGTDLLALGANLVRFFRNESCGKCVPCRLGTEKAVDLLEAAHAGRAQRKELQVLPDLGEAMAQTSICGLGQAALNPILSLMEHWPELAGRQP